VLLSCSPRKIIFPILHPKADVLISISINALRSVGRAFKGKIRTSTCSKNAIVAILCDIGCDSVHVKFYVIVIYIAAIIGCDDTCFVYGYRTIDEYLRMWI
jgi:hypothetical protein